MPNINCLSTRLKRQTSTAYQHGLHAKHQLLHQAYMPLFLHGLHATFSTRRTRLYFYTAYTPLFIHGLHASIYTWLTCHLISTRLLGLYFFAAYTPFNSTWPLIYTCLHGLYFDTAYTPLFLHGSCRYF
jgi:hypothetical protein